MRKKISDLFDLGSEIETASNEAAVDTESISRRTFALIRGENTPAEKRGGARRIKAGVLAAALLAAVLLTSVAATVIVRSLDSGRALKSSGLYRLSPVGVSSDEKEAAEAPAAPIETEPEQEPAATAEDGEAAPAKEAEAPNETASGQEYPALKEWLAFSEEMRLKRESGDMSDYTEDQRLPRDDSTDCYAGDEFIKEREALERIAAKYGLTLHETVKYTPSFEEFYSELNTEPFCDLIPTDYDDDELSAYVYNDGGFAVNGMIYKPEGLGRGVGLNLVREMRGVMPSSFLPSFDGPESYETTDYITSCGKKAELALGPRYSFVFVELENCWVTMHVSGGYEDGPEVNTPGYRARITMDMLKEMADRVDYSKLEG